MALNEIDPSPLFLLDEVDFALDRENLDAFLKILKILAKNAQLIFTSFNEKVLNLQNLNILEITLDESSRLNQLNYEEAELFFKKLT